MKVIRYSQAFKMQLVREVESGKSCAWEVHRKYNIGGPNTVMRWVRQYGSGKYGRIIRVEKADEVNEAARLRGQLRQAKEALADAHMDLALEKAFLGVACEQLGQTAEAFKKKHAGKRRTGRSQSTRSSR
jgi:transposase